MSLERSETRLDELQAKQLERSNIYVREGTEKWGRIFAKEFTLETENKEKKFLDRLKEIETANFLQLVEDVDQRMASKEREANREQIMRIALGDTFLARHELVRAFLKTTDDEETQKRDLAICTHLLFTFADFGNGAVSPRDMPETHLMVAELFGLVVDSSVEDSEILEQAILQVNEISEQRRSLFSSHYVQVLDEVAEKNLWGVIRGARAEVLTYYMVKEILNNNDSGLRKKLGENVWLEKASTKDDAEHDVDWYLVTESEGEHLILAGIDITSENKLIKQRGEQLSTDREEFDYTAGIVAISQAEDGQIEFDGDDSDKPILEKALAWVKQNNAPIIGIRVPSYLLAPNFGINRETKTKDYPAIVQSRYGTTEQREAIQLSLDMIDYALSSKINA